MFPWGCRVEKQLHEQPQKKERIQDAGENRVQGAGFAGLMA